MGAAPDPISYQHFCQLAPAAGFAIVELLADRPSRFMGAIYAAKALKSDVSRATGL